MKVDDGFISSSGLSNPIDESDSPGLGAGGSRLEIQAEAPNASFQSGDIGDELFALDILPKHICDEIFLKMDLTSKIGMKLTSVGMENLMNKYIRAEELQAFYAQLKKNCRDAVEAIVARYENVVFAEQDIQFPGRLYEFTSKMEKMRTYMRENYPDVDLDDGPVNEWDDFDAYMGHRHYYVWDD